ADLSKSSLPLVSVAPMVSPFLCSDDSDLDTEIPERHVSPTTSTLEIPTAPILPVPSTIVAPSSEFPLAPFVAPLGIRQRRAILIQVEEDIPIARLYLTHPGGPYHLSSGHSSSGHSLSRYTPPDTTDVGSSTPQIFVHTPLARTLRCSEAYLRWRPSCKRCRSPVATMTSSIHSTRALVPSRADLLPPRKRFRDLFLLEDSFEEDIDMDVLEDIEADATTVEVTVDRDVKARIDEGIGMEIDVRIDVDDEVEDEVESSDRGTIEVGV
nr:hypothetical protein [Tanacetum cinerariifolium]